MAMKFSVINFQVSTAHPQPIEGGGEEDVLTMTSIVKVTPIIGGQTSIDSAVIDGHAYLLEVDTFTFLLDCGVSDANQVEDGVNALRPYISQIDALLLSHPDPLHLGLLPRLVADTGLSCVIYATEPVHEMGQLFLYDLCQSRYNDGLNLDLKTSLDEVDVAFKNVHRLKYNQTIHLQGKGEGISITPLNAGHMLGGSVWKIRAGEEDLVYAVDFNHKKEQHLKGLDVDQLLRPSPALLITDAFNADVKHVGRRQRDEALMNNILQTLRGEGNVLVCVDTAGRMLELAHMIDHLWQMPDSGLPAYSLALLNSVSYSVIQVAKSQIEWMSDKLLRSFEDKRSNPFQLKHLKLCHTINELSKVPSPKVVLASMADLETGFSRELFLSWCQNSAVSVIFTSRSCNEKSLANKVINVVSNEEDVEKAIELEVTKRVRLSGAELEEHRKREMEKAKSEAEELDEDESTDDDDENPEMPLEQDIIAGQSDSMNKSSFPKNKKSNKFPMFPFYEEKIRWDDYGEIIRPEDWLDASSDGFKSRDLLTGNEASQLDDGLDVIDAPSKCVTEWKFFQIECKIQVMDFEGRSDGESVLKLIGQVKPTRLVLVRGSAKNCIKMAEACRRINVFSENTSGQEQKMDVHVAVNNTAIDATTETFIYQVRLPEKLVSNLKFQKAKDSFVAWVDGFVTHKTETKEGIDSEEVFEETKIKRIEHVAKKLKTSTSDLPSLNPLEDEQMVLNRKSVFINEVKLSDFKLVLTRNGIGSEFQGGVLFCGDQNAVALRRHDSGRVTIEGAVCDDYFRVRELLYQQYAII